MSRFLVQGGCVLSMDPAVGNHREADVLIDGDVIAEIGPGIRARDAEVVEAGGAIVMPGFVDAHRRTVESLFRAHSPDDAGPPVGLTPDDVYAGTLAGLLGAAEAGITTVVDWSELHTHDHAEAAVQAHADAGLRTVLVEAVHMVASNDSGDWQPVSRRSDRAPLMSLGAGVSVPPAGGVQDVARLGSRVRELGRRLFVRAGQLAADPGTASGLATGGLLGPDVTVVHACTLTDAELDAIGTSGAAVTLTPASDMAAGVRPAPVQKLIDRGIRPGLGVGSERLAPGDIVTQIRVVASLQHAHHFELKLAGRANLPRLLTSREVIRYGTIDGAAAAGLGAVTGSLAPGKQADLLILAADRPNIVPVNDPIGAVVWGMDTSNVDWVFVAGRPVVRQGELAADIGRVRDLATAALDRLTAQAGPALDSGAELAG